MEPQDHIHSGTTRVSQMSPDIAHRILTIPTLPDLPFSILRTVENGKKPQVRRQQALDMRAGLINRFSIAGPRIEYLNRPVTATLVVMDGRVELSSELGE